MNIDINKICGKLCAFKQVNIGKKHTFPQFPQFCIIHNVDNLSTSCGNDVEKICGNCGKAILIML